MVIGGSFCTRYARAGGKAELAAQHKFFQAAHDTRGRGESGSSVSAHQLGYYWHNARRWGERELPDTVKKQMEFLEALKKEGKAAFPAAIKRRSRPPASPGRRPHNTKLAPSYKTSIT